MRFAPFRSAAAPGTSHDARTRPVPNHTAPVETGSRAAVERAGAAIPPRPCEAVPRAAATPHLFVIRGGASPRARGTEDLIVITDAAARRSPLTHFIIVITEGAARRSPPTPHLTLITGGPVSGAGIAGMAGPAGAGRPGTFEVPSP